jgi:hypothetical protein
MATVGTGKYTYTLIQDWAKLPPGETFAMVSAVATDSQDRVYAFQRKDPPILVFDREGNLLNSWGNGAFLFAHGIFIADDTVYLTDRDSSVCPYTPWMASPFRCWGDTASTQTRGVSGLAIWCPGLLDPLTTPARWSRRLRETCTSPTGTATLACTGSPGMAI